MKVTLKMERNPKIDVTDKPYISNPFLLLNPTFEAFGIMAIEFLKLLGISILVYLAVCIPAIIGGISIASNKANGPAIGLIALSVLLFIVAAIYLSYPFYKMSLAAARGVVLPWKKSLPASFAQAWGLAWTAGLVGLVVIFGIFAFIVPGVFFILWYSQAQFVAVEEGIYGLAAMRRSKQLVKNRLMDTAGIYGMNQLTQITSNIPGLGSLITLAYAILSLPLAPIRYIQLTQLTETDRTSFPTSKWNYALFFIPGILLVVTIIIFAVTAAQKHA